MIKDEEKIQVIKNIVIQGLVQHSEIIPRLNKAEMQYIDADDVAELVSDYKYGGRFNIGKKIGKSISNFIYKIFSLLTGILCAVIGAAVIISDILVGSAVKEELNSPLDSFLYWVGLKKVNIPMSGPEQITLIFKILESTLKILIVMFIGFIAGIIIFRLLTFLIKFLSRRIILTSKVKKLLDKSKKEASYEQIGQSGQMY